MPFRAARLLLFTSFKRNDSHSLPVERLPAFDSGRVSDWWALQASPNVRILHLMGTGDSGSDPEVWRSTPLVPPAIFPQTLMRQRRACPESLEASESSRSGL